MSVSMLLFNLSFMIFYFLLILHLMISHMLFKCKFLLFLLFLTSLQFRFQLSLLLFFLNLTGLLFSFKLSLFLLLCLFVAFHVLVEFCLSCTILLFRIIFRRVVMANWNDWNVLFNSLMMIDRDDWDFCLVNWSRLTVMFEHHFMVIIMTTWILTFVLFGFMHGVIMSVIDWLFLIHVSQLRAFSPVSVNWGDWCTEMSMRCCPRCFRFLLSLDNLLLDFLRNISLLFL